MEKKGFTLIEIIICIILLGVVGTTSIVVVKNSSNNKTNKVLVENENKFEDALEVYLSEHPEVIANVNDNAKAAVVSLELLKNEGLIKDNLDIDYKNNYYTLANAILIEDPVEVTEEQVAVECANQIEIKTFASWQIDDTSAEVIYVCPRSDVGNENGASQANVDELLERIKALETSFQLVDLGSKNWILFDVEADDADDPKKVSWASGENEDLWSIINAGVANKQLKIVYNQNIPVDNSNEDSSEIKYTTTTTCRKIYAGYRSSTEMTGMKFLDTSKNSFYSSDSKLKKSGFRGIGYKDNNYYIIYNRNTQGDCYINGTISINKSTLYKKNSSYGNNLVKVDNVNAWPFKEMLSNKYDTPGSYKKDLYDKIAADIKGAIVEKDYYYKYVSKNVFNGNPTFKTANDTYRDIFGTLDENDNLNDPSLIGKNFWIGLADYSQLYGSQVYTTISYRVFSSNAFILNRIYGQYESGTNYFDYGIYAVKDELVGGVTGYSLKTYSYTPIITIGIDSFLNYDEYPQAYFVEYPDCKGKDISDFGTKSCPKILKLSNGKNSWGN